MALFAACAPQPALRQPETRGAPPPWITGSFEDDYGGRYTIADSVWLHHPRNRYRIMKWNTGGEYLIAQNDADNPADGGRWTRIDWVRLPGMAPWEWGFGDCRRRRGRHGGPPRHTAHRLQRPPLLTDAKSRPMTRRGAGRAFCNERVTSTGKARFAFFSAVGVIQLLHFLDATMTAGS
jgi:hypothetical protein